MYPVINVYINKLLFIFYYDLFYVFNLNIYNFNFKKYLLTKLLTINYIYMLKFYKIDLTFILITKKNSFRKV